MDNVLSRRIAWDFSRKNHAAFYTFWQKRDKKQTFNNLRDVLHPYKEVWIEVGAGTGNFFYTLSLLYPDKAFVPIEIDRRRAKKLLKKKTTAMANFWPVRGNCIPFLMDVCRDLCITRVYILYPCPYPKTSQRLKRWYFHPIMPLILDILAPQGVIVWVSDQEWYIEEARWVMEHTYHCRAIGEDGQKEGDEIKKFYTFSNIFNDGRTSFEKKFLSQSLHPFELVVVKK